MDIEFDYKGDPVGGVISTCMCITSFCNCNNIIPLTQSRFIRKGIAIFQSYMPMYT